MSQRDAQVTVGTIAKVLLWFVYAWVIVSLVLLVLAFILELFGANPDAGFARGFAPEGGPFHFHGWRNGVMKSCSSPATPGRTERFSASTARISSIR